MVLNISRDTVGMGIRSSTVSKQQDRGRPPRGSKVMGDTSSRKCRHATLEDKEWRIVDLGCKKCRHAPSSSSVDDVVMVCAFVDLTLPDQSMAAVATVDRSENEPREASVAGIKGGTTRAEGKARGQ